MDPKDQILNGESAETPTTSPVETTTPDEGNSSVSSQSAETQSPEEERWNTLGGAAQERFRQVTRENNLLRERLDRLERTTVQPQVPVTNNGFQNPEVKAAVERLSQVGVATTESVEKAIDQKMAGLVYQFEIERLENKYNGESGLPKFDREEYRDYVARHPQYQHYTPEDVYEKMYAPEIFEWKAANSGRRSAASQGVTTTLKPTRTQVREEPLTPEAIEQRLGQPDGRQWYEQNRDKVNAVLSKTATPAW